MIYLCKDETIIRLYKQLLPISINIYHGFRKKLSEILLNWPYPEAPHLANQGTPSHFWRIYVKRE